MLNITKEDVTELLSFMLDADFNEQVLKCYSKEIHKINDNCNSLSLEDCPAEILENSDGYLCGHYPPFITIPHTRHLSSSVTDLGQLMLQSKFARCRTRFVVPSFSFNHKNVCRCSTLSGPLEFYGRQVATAAGFTFDGHVSTFSSGGESPDTNPEIENGRQSLEKLRDDDCELIRRLNVTYICDFMLEYRKIKCWVPISSSEKVDQQGRYNDFVVIPLPYPGSEFFRIWRDSGYTMHNLYFDWNRSGVEVPVNPDLIPRTLLSSSIKWCSYKSWDIYTITVNYLKLLLGLLYEGAGGLLLHCVSGWDRTPLFVCLLRCLLWADDLMHCSLTPIQMLYLTLGYDWFLFGHKLKTRMELGEEILRFTFNFISEMADCTELSLRSVYDIHITDESKSSDSDDSSFIDLRSSDDLQPLRKSRLKELSNLFFQFWDEETKKRETQFTINEPLASNKNTQLASDSVEKSTFNNDDVDELSQSYACKNINKPSESQNSIVFQISNALNSAVSAVTSNFVNPLLSSSSHSSKAANEGKSIKEPVT
ncbi:Myotubularin-related protein 14 [Schistosoma japonicum]|nr:Myotubularin-related protein 14 [Schistosoma japonicum]